MDIIDEKEIVFAVENDDNNKVEELIRKGFNKSYQFLDTNGLPGKVKLLSPTIIALSAYYNSVNTLTYLFKNGCLNENVDKYNTPISHYASMNGSTSALSVISNYKQEFSGAIFAAIEGKSLESIKWLKRNNYFDINEIDERGVSIAFAAIEANFGKGLKYLVKKCGCQIRAEYEGSPLIYALGHGLWDAAYVLINDIKYSLEGIDGNGNTTLHLACYAMHQKIAQAIVDREPSLIKSKNKNGQTPMDFCSDKDFLKIIIPEKINSDKNENNQNDLKTDNIKKDDGGDSKEDEKDKNTKNEVVDNDCSQTCLLV